MTDKYRKWLCKSLKIVWAGSFFGVIGLSGCSNSQPPVDSGTVSEQGREQPVSFTEAQEEMDIADFQMNSIPVSIPEGVKAIPQGISNTGMIALSLENEQGYTGVGCFDSRTQTFERIEQLDFENKETSYYLAGINDTYILVGRAIPVDSGYVNTVLAYDFTSQQVQTIAEYLTFFPDHAIGTFADSSLYLNYRDGESYKTFRYAEPLNTESSVVVFPENSGSPVEMDGNLYCIEMEQESQTTTLWKMDLNGDNKQEILSSQAADGWFSNLLKWKNWLVLTRASADGSATEILKVNPDLKDYEVIETVDGFIDSPQIGLDLMIWWNPWDLGERIHTKYSVFDLKTSSYIEYRESILFVSDYGIVWVKFTKNESDIPKGMIFEPDNSEIMLFRSQLQ